MLTKITVWNNKADQMSNIDETARIKLIRVMEAVQPVINECISDMNSAEINYILTNYKKYLKIDIERDLLQAKEANLKSSPFDEILNNGFEL